MGESVDTVVVGGGIVGVCTAYHLARRHKEVLLLEKLVSTFSLITISPHLTAET